MTTWFLAPGSSSVIITDTYSAVLLGDRAGEYRQLLLNGGATSLTAEQAIATLVEGGLHEELSFCVCSLVEDDLTAVLRGAIALRIEGDWAASSLFDGREVRTVREVAFEGVSRVGILTDESPINLHQPLSGEGFSEVHIGHHSGSALIMTSTPSETMLTNEIPRPRESGQRQRRTPPQEGEHLPDTDSFPDDLFGATLERDPDGAAATAGGVSESGGAPHLSAVARQGIVARLCAKGHANRPERADCSTCSEPLVGGQTAQSRETPRGSLLLPDGMEIPIVGTMLIGRSPRVERGDAGDIPALVRVLDPTRDVSRTHLRVSVEGWQVSVEDLGSTNGTELMSSEGARSQLAPNEPTVIRAGDSVVLGGVVRVRFRGIA